MWKSRTEYAFDGSGYKRVLTDVTYDNQNTHMNQVVYSKIKLATVVGTEHHLVKQHKEDMNGYVAWNNLCEWYDRDAVNNETAYSLRFKLEI